VDSLSYIVNVEAAIYKGEKWLIIKRGEKEAHAPGLLSMVGGKVETNVAMSNVLEEALQREIMEEVGIKIASKIHYVESKSFVTDKGEMVIDIVFLCTYQSGEPKCISSDEVSDVHWLTFAEVLSNTNSPRWLVESLKKAEKVRLEIEKT
jgi:NADH pyrophosphatase NudC (nudix superfamily)